MRRAAAVALVLAVVVLAAGCGSGGNVAFSKGVFHIGSGVDASSLAKSVLGVKAGTRVSVVRSQFGAPMHRNKARNLTCWFYRAEQPNSSVDGLGFCMTPAHRVGRITVSVHL